MPQRQDRPFRVVIVGAGFGGLEAARALRRAPVEVTLIDRRNYHLFQPLLYQVATAALSPGDIAWPVRSITRRQRNLLAVMAEVTGVDLVARVVHTGEGVEFPYDALVLAAGSTQAYFGHDEWAGAAPALKTIEDGTIIRSRLLTAFERAEIEEDPAEQQHRMTFVVVGGGATGVELAGAIAELGRHTLPRDFRRIHPELARIVLIEAGPHLLNAFPDKLSDYARHFLERLGVEVLTGTMVTGCDARGVTCGDRYIGASTIIWAAGVKASSVGGWLGAECDHAGRVRVGPDLSVPGRPEIFVVGDLATVTWGGGRNVPGVAPAAKQMGHYVGRLLAARAGGGTVAAPFRYRHQGDLATLGRGSAVVAMYGVQASGLLAWWLWALAHIWFLIGFRSRVVVSFLWLWSYVTSQRGAQLITGTPESPSQDSVVPVSVAGARPGGSAPWTPVKDSRP